MNAPEDSLQLQLEERIRFERLLADLSAQFVGVLPEALDEYILDAQRRICETLGLDRSTLGQPSKSGEPQLTHSWAIPESKATPPCPAAHLVPWCTKLVSSGHTIRFTSLDELPPEAATDKESFRRAGVKSSVTFPLLVGGKVVGSLTFGTVKAERRWSEDLVDRLRLVAEVFAGALARRASEAALRDAIAAVEAMKERLQAENVSLRQDLQLLERHTRILGRSAALRNVLAQVEQVAPTDSTVLLLGETGTGKGLIAANIHELSSRRSRRMLQVNCSAIPSTLIESELFGREKGAYTGALSRQVGRFEAANGSTLFLDEIGELPPEVQLKLLRVLQDRQIERLGSSATMVVDVRIIAATNLDLEKAVADGKFRQDLYYRLNVFPITVPPLRDRQEDISLLVQAFADEFSKAMGKTVTSISQSNLEALQRYPWPGNIRELRNVIERAVILARGPKLNVEVPSVQSLSTAAILSLEDVERAHILRILERTGWRVQGKGGAAELLGIKRTTLQHRMEKLSIVRPRK